MEKRITDNVAGTSIAEYDTIMLYEIKKLFRTGPNKSTVGKREVIKKWRGVMECTILVSAFF